MLKIKILFFVKACLILFALNVQAQFTRQMAVDTVLNHLLAADTAWINVYLANGTMTNEDTVVLFTQTRVQCPYSNNYVFFVDDRPLANWEHPCRLLFIDAATGSYSITNLYAFPANLADEYEIIKNVQMPEPVQLPPSSTEVILNGADPNPHLYAVLIAGWIYPENDFDTVRFSNDLAAMYNTLKGVYGYTDDHLFVHYRNGIWTNSLYKADFDNDENDDIDYAATKARVIETFENLSGISNSDPNVPELGPEDMLFVYVSGHGGPPTPPDRPYHHICLQNASYINWDDPFYNNELYTCVKDINCSQMVFLMNQCNAGGFWSSLVPEPSWPCQKVEFYFSAQADEPGYGELYITGLRYEEFSYYFTAALRGSYPNNDFPYQTYCPTGGFQFELIQYFENHPSDYVPDINGDEYVSFAEAFDYANNMDSWSEEGFYQPYPDWPSSWKETPEYFSTEDLAAFHTPMGYLGDGTSEFETGVYLIGGKLSGNIDIGDDVTFLFGNAEAEIEAQNLITGDNVTFKALYSSNQIVVDESFQSDLNNLFTSEGPDWNVYLNGTGMQTVIDDATFEKCKLHNYGSSLTISNSTFDDCVQLSSHSGNVDISDCDFSDTWLNLEDLSAEQYSADVTGCNFTNGSAIVAIDIWDYDNFNVVSNTIDGFICGVQVYQSGFGQRGNQLINENVIENCTVAGILAYNSYCDIYSNTIRNNYSGVKLLGSGDVMLGTPDMIIPGTTIQEISDNTSYEVYASINMFPQYFKYNIIVDDDNAGNPNDPLVYCNFGASDENNRLDVKYNCWGSNFNYAADLYPSNMYWYLPYWCPPESEGESEESDIMLQSGLDYFEDGNYENAKSVFESVIDQYPETSAAKAAMKELLRTEKYLGEDYQTLKTYYLTNDTIVSDATLEILGDRLANDCDVKLENWENAITWYENMIENPPTFEDSIFAIIDLGYTYLLMENSGLKSAYKGSLTQHIPVSQGRFIENRDYLLSLLPGELKNSANNQMNGVNKHQAEIMQNEPNPFSSTTQIAFKLNTECDVEISITDYTGKSLKTINLGVKEIGTHSITFSAQNFNPGIYFYTLITNGIPTETRKMIILK